MTGVIDGLTGVTAGCAVGVGEGAVVLVVDTGGGDATGGDVIVTG